MIKSLFKHFLAFSRDRVRTITVWIHRSPFSSPWLLVAAITFLGGVFRFWGIFHGFQERFIYHPDAGGIFQEAWRVYLTGETQGTYFGAVYLQQLVGFMKTLDQVSRFLGNPIVWSFEHIGAVGSLLSASLGTATIPVVYFLGTKTHSKSVGVLGALFLSVNPLHSLHSHYPYRDVPLVFFLTLTLFLCLLIAQKPTVLKILAAGLFGLISAAVKPAGLLVFIPLFTASVLGLIRSKKWLSLFLMGLMFVAAMLLMQFYRMSFLIAQHGNLLHFVFFYFSVLSTNVLFGLEKSLLLQVYWVGYPLLVACLAGILYGLWRRKDQDIILISFFLPAFLLSAVYRYLDERFLIFLLPVALILGSRLFVEMWPLLSKKTGGRFLTGLAILGLLFQGSLQSLWQGILFTLPDTLVLSEKWLTAHIPRNVPVVMQGGYYPRNLNTWPKVSFLDPSRPIAEERKKGKLFVTSSTDYLHRWLLFPKKFPRENRFYQDLPREATLMKSIAFEPLGFVHPTVKVYLAFKPPFPLLPLNLPRPYDNTWNDGICFVDKSPYDRDDRTMLLNGISQYSALLVSRQSMKPLAVFLQNANRPCRIKVRLGGKTKIRDLSPGEKQVLFFDPWWLLPRKPALYSFKIYLSDAEAQVLVHLRCGDQEIAEMYALWQYWNDSVRYYEKQVARYPDEIDSQISLATIYEILGRRPDARNLVQRIQERAPALLDQFVRLGNPEISPGNWASHFREATGLDPAILTFSLSQDFEAERFYGIGSHRQQDIQASGDYQITYKPGRNDPGFFVNENLLLSPGAYTAWFYLKSAERNKKVPLADIRIFSGDEETASKRIHGAEIERQNGFVRIPIPLIHTHPWKGISIQITGTGRGTFSLDKVRLEPDLQKICQQKVSAFHRLADK